MHRICWILPNPRALPLFVILVDAERFEGWGKSFKKCRTKGLHFITGVWMVQIDYMDLFWGCPQKGPLRRARAGARGKPRPIYIYIYINKAPRARGGGVFTPSKKGTFLHEVYWQNKSLDVIVLYVRKQKPFSNLINTLSVTW